MRRLYQANDLPEAYLLLGWLQMAQVEAWVLNENAQGALGEIPFTHTYPEVWILDEQQWQRAEQVLTQFENRQSSEREYYCPRCHQPNPDNFETCWHCGATLSPDPEAE